jgi:uncharacterized protein YceH (UPF0502 family)
MSDNEPSVPATPAPKWKPIGPVERRVLGVLVEKAKTTPDAYPLTLNGLTTGCNQKSNRDPQMNLEPDQIESALERLRHMSAVIEVSGSGRVSKYRHLVYEWLGVDKLEAAVMTELLLRGAQTVGELRGRAARMEPIADVAALQPVLQSLEQKGLLMSLTPPGRGQVVTHALYLPHELDKIRGSVAHGGPMEAPPSAAPPSPRPTAPLATPAASAAPTATANGRADAEVQQLRQELDQLKAEVARLKGEVQDLWSNLR